MARPQELLADALRALQALQAGGKHAIRSQDLSRTHRERLLRAGFIDEVMKGWYIPARPSDPGGDSTAWYASFWGFCADYLKHRFGDDWVLSPEQSLALHAGNWTVPHQLLLRSSKGGNKPTNLRHHTSVFDLRLELPPAADIVTVDGLRLYTLEAALVAVPAPHYTACTADMRTALSMLPKPNELLRRLLDGGHSTVAGRLSGALRNIGAGELADEFLKSFRSAGYTLAENDPFDDAAPALFNPREPSPWVNRIRILWHEMRDQIPEHFPQIPNEPVDPIEYLKEVDDRYVNDAYHSLSIEGYLVSDELIRQVADGDWQPDLDASDREQAGALAARGYWQAFQAVKLSVDAVLQGANPAAVAARAHSDWYRELFAPSVTAGIAQPGDLAGYRNRPVYITGSRHTAPRHEALSDAMDTYFELLSGEEQPAVRVVLGHFVFVYIHPYIDGNGRMGRFLMNLMCASSGYPWTIVPVDRRDEYMSALESGSAGNDIVPFTRFLASLFEN